jgi:cobalamin synthase
VLFGNSKSPFSQQAVRGRTARQNGVIHISGSAASFGREGSVRLACAIPTTTTAFLVLLEAKIGGCAGDTAGTDETFLKTTCIGAFAAKLDAPMDPGE